MREMRRQHSAALCQQVMRAQKPRHLGNLIRVHVPLAGRIRAIGVIQNRAGKRVPPAAQCRPNGGVEEQRIRPVKQGGLAIPNGIEQRAAVSIVRRGQRQNMVTPQPQFFARLCGAKMQAQACLPALIEAPASSRLRAAESASAAGREAQSVSGAISSSAVAYSARRVTRCPASK